MISFIKALPPARSTGSGTPADDVNALVAAIEEARAILFSAAIKDDTGKLDAAVMPQTVTAAVADRVILVDGKLPANIIPAAPAAAPANGSVTEPKMADLSVPRRAVILGAVDTPQLSTGVQTTLLGAVRAPNPLPAVSPAAGGTTVDAEARATLGAILEVMRSAGLATVADTISPSIPGTPTATAGPGSASVTTSGSTDNVAVTSYRWYRGTTVAGTTTGKTFSETGLPAGVAVAYTVEALDGAGNVSPRSALSNSVTPTAVVTTVTRLADDFSGGDRADLTGRATPVGARAWRTSNTANTAGIVGGVAKATAGSGNSLVSVDYGSAEMRVRATIAAIAPSSQTRVLNLFGRYADENNYVMLRPKSTSGGPWELVERVNGVGTVLGEAANFPTAGEEILMVFTNSKVDTYRNGLVLLTSPLNAATTGTGAGIGFKHSFSDGSAADRISAWSSFSVDA